MRCAWCVRRRAPRDDPGPGNGQPLSASPRHRLLGLVLLLAAGGLPSPARGAPQEPSSPLSEGDRRYLRNQLERIEEAKLQQNFQRAANLTEKLVERFPDQVRSWLVLAEIHLQPSWAQRNDTRAEQAASEALRLGGRDPRILTALALAKFHQRRTSEVLDLIAELVDGPRPLVGRDWSADLLVARATLRRESGDPAESERAMADLERAIELVPLHGEARLERAEHLYLAGDREAALTDLQAVRDVIPGAAKLHYLLFKSYLAQGRSQEAQQAREVYDCIYRLTSVMSTRTAPGADEQLELHRRLWTLNPQDRDRRFRRVELEIETGHLAEARSALEELAAQQGSWPPLRFLESKLGRAERGEPLDADEQDDG